MCIVLDLFYLQYFVKVFQYSACRTFKSRTEPSSSSRNFSFSYQTFNLLCAVYLGERWLSISISRHQYLPIKRTPHIAHLSYITAMWQVELFFFDFSYFLWTFLKIIKAVNQTKQRCDSIRLPDLTP